MQVVILDRCLISYAVSIYSRVQSGMTMTETIRIMHVDDDARIRALTEGAIRRQEEAVEVVGTPRLNAAPVPLDRIDCLVVETAWPLRSGTTAVETIRRTRPALPVVVFTSAPRDELPASLLAQDGVGYVHKGGRAAQFDIVAERAVALASRPSPPAPVAAESPSD
jgi:DNA-binding NtrC family response regulator